VADERIASTALHVHSAKRIATSAFAGTFLSTGLHLQALKVQYDALKTLAGNTQAQLQSTKAQLQHAEASSLQAQQQILEAESAGKTQQRNAEVAEEQCRMWR